MRINHGLRMRRTRGSGDAAHARVVTALLVDQDGEYEGLKGTFDAKRICRTLRCEIVQQLPCKLISELPEAIAFEFESSTKALLLGESIDVWADDSGHCKHEFPNDNASWMLGVTLFGSVLLTRQGGVVSK